MILTNTCTKCGFTKAAGCFSPDKRRKSGFQSWCRECIKTSMAQNRALNPEISRLAARARSKKYYENNKEKDLQRQKLWREQHRDKYIESQRKYYQNNSHLYVLKATMRDAYKTKAVPIWANLHAIAGMYELAKLFRRAGINLHVDHIVPLRGKFVCGLHCEDNLQLLSANDNIRKSNKFEYEVI